jgi:hypothetical protein
VMVLNWVGAGMSVMQVPLIMDYWGGVRATRMLSIVALLTRGQTPRMKQDQRDGVVWSASDEMQKMESMVC